MGRHTFGYSHQALIFKNKKTGTYVRFFYFDDLAFILKTHFQLKKPY